MLEFQRSYERASKMVVGTSKSCINDPDVTPDALAYARKGIENPVEMCLPSGTPLYRFGSTRIQASIGSWWFGQEEYYQIESFALLNGLTFAYSARLLTAVLEEYNDFNYLRKVTTQANLRAYVGKSLPQAGKAIEVTNGRGALPIKKSVIGNQINRSTAGERFLQYCIPGLHKSDLNKEALGQTIVVKVIPAGSSHMFGTKLAPKGVVQH